MKIVSKQKVNFWRRKQKILVYNKHTINPFLEANFISFSYIPRNSKKAQFKLHTQFPLIWLDSRPIWWTISSRPMLLHLGHTMKQRQWWVYRKKYTDPEASDRGPDIPPIRRIIIFIYSPFGAHHLGNSIQSLWIYMNKLKKFLDEIFHLRENGDFSQFRKILQFAENDNLYLKEKFH